MYCRLVAVLDLPPAILPLLAEPRRWRLLLELAAGDRRVGELVARTGDPQNLVSYHLRALRDAGLVSSRRSSFDGRDTYYRAHVERIGAALGSVGATLDPALVTTPSPPVVARRRPSPRVLFLCTGNSARSQIAEALTVDLSGGAVHASSAGSHPKPLHPNAVRVLAERGIDISHRRSKHLDRFVGTRFDHVVTLCDKVREVCPELPGQPTTAHWSTADPALTGATDDETYPAFVALADDLEVRVHHLLARIATREEGHRHGR
ncbi:MAG: metalloregulator ArsR/SmtB family transcription factor [Acidimicrobiales bacterium]